MGSQRLRLAGMIYEATVSDAEHVPGQHRIRVRNYSGTLYVLWSLVICMSLGWNFYHGRVAVLEVARTQAHAAYDRDLVYREWSESVGGIYVPASPAKPASPALATPDGDVQSAEGMHLVLTNHAFMTRQVYELAEMDFGVRGHLTSLNPLNKENSPDAWERKALELVGGDSNDYASVDVIDGAEYMRLMHPLVNEQRCLGCHQENGHKLGDTLGGISVGVPMAPFWKAENTRMLHLAGGHSAIWGFGLIGMVIGSRRMRKQVRKRAQAEMQLRESESELRELHRQVSLVSKLLEDAFGRYVNPHIVKEILESPEPLRLGGERKMVTVLISDIRGFTDLSERLDAESLVEFLNSYFSAMADVVFAHEGTLDKFMGDAIIVLFGAPIARADDPIRAVKVALEMQARLKELNAKADALGYPQVATGFGISTGEMVVGNIGSPRRHDYTAIGRDVNIAKRLESLTKETTCDILVSESTYLLVRDQVQAVDLGLQSIRGIEEPMHVYGINGLR